MGRPLRAVARGRRGAAGAGPPPRQCAGARHRRGRHELGPARRRAPADAAAVADHAARQRAGPPAPACSGGDVPRRARAIACTRSRGRAGRRGRAPGDRRAPAGHPGRFQALRGHLVTCPAREVAHRSPCAPRRRCRLGRVRGADERSDGQRQCDQPGLAQCPSPRHCRERGVPVLPELGGIPVLERQPGGPAAGDRRRHGAERRGQPDGQQRVRRHLSRHRGRPRARRTARRHAQRDGGLGPADRRAGQPGQPDHRCDATGGPDGAGPEPQVQLWRGQSADGRAGARLAALLVRRRAGAVRRHRQRAAGGPRRRRRF